jgi:hypothetical protein
MAKSILKNIKAAPSAKAVKAVGKKLIKTAKGETVVATHDIHNKSLAPTAPVTPLTQAFVKAGFVYSRTEEVDNNTAHGYTREDGAALLFTHAGSSSSINTAWQVKFADGSTAEGKNAQQFVKTMYDAKGPAPLPSNVVAALDALRKLTAGKYRISDLAGDANYKARVQLLKLLRKTDKVLVKESGVNKVLTEFYVALGIAKSSVAGMESAFSAKCMELAKSASKTERAVAKVEKAVIADELRKTVHTRVVFDGKPILDAPKKMNKKQEAKDSADFKLELAARVKRAERETANMPMAQPKSDADIYVNLDEIFLLEDPNNGIVLLQLEKPNSQGAICVYNNGSRVAAGVVPTEVLRTLRQITSSDLVRDVNQLLHPITAGVVVSSVAERHLTAVLDHCKENIMTTATVETKKQKFAPPAGTAKKTAKNAVTTKVKATVTKKADKAPRAAAADRKIKALVTLKSESLPREGSFCYGQVEAIIGSKTVSEAQAKLDKSKLNPSGRKLEVAWLVKQGYLSVIE